MSVAFTNDTNIALCKALGVTDITGVTRVTLVVEAFEIPKVTIERHLMNSDGLIQAVLQHQLVAAQKTGD